MLLFCYRLDIVPVCIIVYVILYMIFFYFLVMWLKDLPTQILMNEYPSLLTHGQVWSFKFFIKYCISHDQQIGEYFQWMLSIDGERIHNETNRGVTGRADLVGHTLPVAALSLCFSLYFPHRPPPPPSKEQQISAKE